MEKKEEDKNLFEKYMTYRFFTGLFALAIFIIIVIYEVIKDSLS